MQVIDQLIKENDQLQAEIERLLKELQQAKDQTLFYKAILEMVKKENQ